MDEAQKWGNSQSASKPLLAVLFALMQWLCRESSNRNHGRRERRSGTSRKAPLSAMRKACVMLTIPESARDTWGNLVNDHKRLMRWR